MNIYFKNNILNLKFFQSSTKDEFRKINAKLTYNFVNFYANN